jgi:hypothetical protein
MRDLRSLGEVLDYLSATETITRATPIRRAGSWTALARADGEPRPVPIGAFIDLFLAGGQAV